MSNLDIYVSLFFYINVKVVLEICYKNTCTHTHTGGIPLLYTLCYFLAVKWSLKQEHSLGQPGLGNLINLEKYLIKAVLNRKQPVKSDMVA